MTSIILGERNTDLLAIVIITIFSQFILLWSIRKRCSIYQVM